MLLQDLGEDGDGRVDRVGDDEDHGGGGVLGGGLGEVSNDRSVGVLRERIRINMSMMSRGNCTGREEKEDSRKGRHGCITGHSISVHMSASLSSWYT